MAMDVKREGVARKKAIRRAVIIVITLAAVGAISWQLSKLKPAAPTVERATVWIDSVKRGPIVIERRGLGTLVPEDIVWIPAQFDSQVARIDKKGGDEVQPNSTIMVLSNPDMEVAANDLEWQIKQAQADLQDTRVKLESQRFDQQSVVESTESDMKQAELTKDRDQQLLKLNLKDSIDAQIDSKKVAIEKLQAQYTLKKKQVDELTIRAGLSGKVQEMTLQVGQKVKPGDVLAKVASPQKLMAR